MGIDCARRKINVRCKVSDGMLKYKKMGIARASERRKSQLNGHSTESGGSNNLDQAAFKVLWRYALGLRKRRLSKALCL